MPFNIGGEIFNSYHADLQDYRNIITRGLILHLDASTMESYPGSGNTWFDLSNTGNDGTLTNSPTYSSTDGGIITFNGSNNYIYRGNFINPPTTNFTMNAIVKFLDTGAGGRYIMALGRDIGTNGGMALIAYGYSSANSGQIIFELGSAFGRVSSGIIPTTGIWYDLTATANGTSTKFYVNGVLKNTGTQSTGQIAFSPGLSIGSYLNSAIPPVAGNPFFYGNIASVKIYNRELSDTEVLQNYNAQKARFGL
jgi:hypothetical protein